MARIYVGTYTQPEDHVDGHGEGIYCFSLCERTLTLTQQHVVRAITNPSYLALGAHGSTLYAAAEITDGDGRLFAYAVDRNTGALTLLGHRSSLGGAPCYVTADMQHILAANYLGGSVGVWPLDPRGGLLPNSDHRHHHGSSVNPQRQQAPHPHAIVLDPAGEYALVPDLGTDMVVSYAYDRAAGRLGNPAVSLRTRPGAGPRHLVFGHQGRCAYVINELDSTIMACRYRRGELTPMQTVAALPKSFTGPPSGADIRLHPSGRFLYASLRDINCIIRMRVDSATGRLTGRAYAHVLGVTPRNFAVDPGGRYLIVANQDSDTLVMMAIDPATGLLNPVGTPVPVPSPACVVIAP